MYVAYFDYQYIVLSTFQYATTVIHNILFFVLCSVLIIHLLKFWETPHPHPRRIVLMHN